MQLDKLVELINSKPTPNSSKVNGAKLARRDWPKDRIYLPTKKTTGMFGFGGENIFWSEIRRLREATDKGSDKFSDSHEGSTGWEYSSTLFHILGDIRFTPMETSRDYGKVSTANKITVNTDVDEAKVTLKDTFKLNGKKITTVIYSGMDEINKRNEMIQNDTYKFGFICNLHTHPKIRQGDGSYYYSFFSAQDFMSFANSNMSMMGLITNRLYILGKTTESEMPLLGDISNATRAELNDPASVVMAGADLASKYEWTLFVAEFGDSFLRRVA